MTCSRQQFFELLSPIGPTGQIVEVAAIREPKGTEARPQSSAKALGRLLPSVITVQHPIDHFGSGQEAQALGWEMGAARTDDGKLPAHRRQVIEDAFDQEDHTTTDGAFEAEDRPLSAKSQVLGAMCVMTKVATDEPEAVPSPNFRHDDAAGQELGQGASAISMCRLTQQSQLLSGVEARAA